MHDIASFALSLDSTGALAAVAKGHRAVLLEEDGGAICGRGRKSLHVLGITAASVAANLFDRIEGAW